MRLAAAENPVFLQENRVSGQKKEFLRHGMGQMHGRTPCVAFAGRLTVSEASCAIAVLRCTATSQEAIVRSVSID